MECEGELDAKVVCDLGNFILTIGEYVSQQKQPPNVNCGAMTLQSTLSANALMSFQHFCKSQTNGALA